MESARGDGGRGPQPCQAPTYPTSRSTVGKGARVSGGIRFARSAGCDAPRGTIRTCAERAVDGRTAMKKLRDIMRSGFLFMVQRDAMVTEAVRLMAEYNVGIVIVMDGSRVSGVFSERDVARRVVDRGLDPARTRVHDVM